MIAFYALIMGTGLIAGALWLLSARIRFIRRAQIVTARVIAKVYRNSSTETRSSRARVLKLRFEHPVSGQSEYVCDTSVLTPFYKINDVVKVAVNAERVLIAEAGYVVLAPLVLSALGGGCMATFFVVGQA